jgi:hypothetical protein
MSETKMNEKKFVMNEYLDVNVKRNLVHLCSDCYHALGWIIINTSTGIDSVTLKLQRDRKIKNRVALCDLQRKCEDAFSAIEKLESLRTLKAMAVSIGVGLVGTAFMAGSVFAYLASMIPICVIFAIPAFIGWGLPYFLYKKYIMESTEKVNPMIDSNYYVIYEACEKASQLLD